MKKTARIRDPYAEVIGRFNKSGVRYVVVGMSGINYYASDARDMFMTQDYDIFVKPTIGNVRKALAVFKGLGYSLSVKDSALKDSFIKKAVADRNTISAAGPYGVMFELILAVSGYRFDQMALGATVFIVENVPVKVAKLGKLLRSKKTAARDKDKLFLRRYEMLLKGKM